MAITADAQHRAVKMKVLIRFGFGSIPISNFYAVFPKGGLHDFEGSILLLVLPNAAQQDCDCV